MVKPITKVVNKWAEHFGGRERLNDSVAYQAYVSLRFPEHAKLIRDERRFYAGLLNKVGSELVFDIGAHSGAKAVLLAALAERVVCVEPSPGSVAILKRRFRTNRKVAIEAKGVAATEGMATFHIFEATSGVNTFSDKWAAAIGINGKTSETIAVSITTLDQLIKAYGIPNYIKIAAEGFELEVIKGLSQPVSLINFECNLPTFLEPTLEIIDRLARLLPSARFNYYDTESPTKFLSEHWLSRDGISSVVRSGQFSYLEIYSRSGG
jgi:FkbM family methyltransferase